MRKVFEISLLFLLPVILCSCPYSSPYTLDEQPGIYVEDALLGNWTALISKQSGSRQEVVYMSLGRRSDTEYDIAFTGDLNSLRRYNVIKSDSVKGTAFMSTVGGRQFLNINLNARVYIAELQLKNDRLSLLPLVEHFTSKMIMSNEALRNSVDFHYKTRVHPMLDDDFCLKDMVKSN
ncbi:MAG TPA: hypothetical protein PLZ45_01655 [Ferruginibacter sp.]|nr:hypothetical protein [Chitinophagaceae bacterium]HRI23344.1 hypothetical protein [Ferruginibacter sp.]